MSLGLSNTDQLYIRRELANGKFTFQTVQSGGNNGVISLQPYGGSVGIGTHTPDSPLHVETPVSHSTIATFGATGDTGETYQAILIKNDVSGYPALANASSPDVLDIRSAGSVQATIDSNNNDTNKFFRVTANGQGTSGTELFRVDEDGNVGIGTDSPADILDINSDKASAVSNVYIRNHATLGGAALNLFTQGTYNSPQHKAIIGCTDSGGTIRMGAASNDPLLLLVNNSPMVHIDTSGRVLIGTQTQNNNARLQVTTTNQVVATFEGTGVSDPQIYVGDNMASPTDNCIILGYDKADNRGYLTVGGDGDNVFTIANGGNVGINETTPDALLDIGGNLSLIHI